MHEFSAACSIVEAALETATQHNVRRVVAVNVQVGEFTFLIPEQLEFNFEVASKGTLLEGATLNIDIVHGRIQCQECGYEGVAQTPGGLSPEIAMFAPMQCPSCGSSATVIVGGKEFIVTNIEVEMEGPDDQICPTEPAQCGGQAHT